MKVLVVDAALAVRTRLVALLVEASIDVVAEVSTAHHARMAACTHAIDAIVLDVDIPDGLALIDDLRSLAPLAGLIVLTNALSYRRHCIMLGVDAFLDKSTDFGAVGEMLRSLRASERCRA